MHSAADQFVQTLHYRDESHAISQCAVTEPLSISHLHHSGESKKDKKEEGRNALFSHCASSLSTDLFVWKEFPFTLPHSSFVTEEDNEEARYLDITGSLFSVPFSVQSELKHLSVHDDGRKKKLTKHQLAQIRDTGCFSVPSSTFGKDFHWKLTALLSSGNKTHTYNMSYGMALCSILWEYIPTYFTSSAPISLLASLRGFSTFATDILALLIGIPEYRDKEAKSYVLQKQRQAFLLQEFSTSFELFLHDVKKRTEMDSQELLYDSPFPEGVMIADGRDIRFDARYWDPTFYSMIITITNPLLCEVHRIWEQERVSFVKKQIEKCNASPSQPIHDMEQKVILLCKDELYNRVTTAITECKDLQKIEAVHLLLSFIFSNRIIDEATTNIEERRRKLMGECEKKVIAKHPIKSLEASWRETEKTKFVFAELNLNPHEITLTEYYQEETYEYVLQELASILQSEKKEKYDPHFLLCIEDRFYWLQRDLQWKREHKKNNLKALEEASHPNRIPAKIFKWRAAILSSANHPIQQRNDGSYYKTTYEELSVSSDRWFWRWRAVGVRSWAWIKNSLSHCSHSLCYGTHSVKALFSLQKFSTKIFVDPKSGENVNGAFAHSITTRLISLFQNVKESRRVFEAAPDTGFMGKGITRWINLLWNYGCKVGLGVPLLLLIRISMIIGSLLIHLALLPVLVLGSPVASLLSYLWNIFLFDTISTGRFYVVFFPVLSPILLRLGLQGVGQAAFSLLLALILHPVFSVLCLGYYGGKAVLGYMYDFVMYHLVVKFRARVPETNSFSATCIGGPIGNSFFYETQVSAALTVLQLQLEAEELSMYEVLTRSFLRLPSLLLHDFEEDVFSPFGLGGMSLKDNGLEVRLSKLLRNRRDATPHASISHGVSSHLLRLREDQVQELEEKATEMVKEFVQKRVHEALFHDNEELLGVFWARYQVQIHDWEGLARVMLEKWIGPNILQPLLEDDCSVSLKVNHAAKLDQFVSMILHDKPRNDLDDKRANIKGINLSSTTRILNEIKRQQVAHPLQGKGLEGGSEIWMACKELVKE